MHRLTPAARRFALLAFLALGCGGSEEPLSTSQGTSASEALTADSQDPAQAATLANALPDHPSVRYSHLTWSTVGPRKAEFSIRGAFARTYPGSGPDGKLVTGDIFSENLSQANLCFGDGSCVGPLAYEVTDYDAAKGWFLARAVTVWDDQSSPGTGVSVAEGEPNSELATANSMNMGDDFLSTLSDWNDADFVSFTLTQRTRVSIRAVLQTLAEAHLSLWSSSGEMIDTGHDATAPSIIRTLEAGTYFIRMGSWYYSTGTSRIELRQFAAHAPEPLTHTYTGNGPYTAQLKSCCTGYPYDVELASPVRFDIPNSSPVSTLPVVIEAPYNSPNFTFQIPATDAEGDQLTFRLPTIWENPYLSTSYPWGMTISSSGLVTWSNVGFDAGALWVPQVVIEERRNGQLIGSSALSFSVRIVTATTTPPSCLVTPQPSYTVNTGEPVQFTVSISDPDAGDRLTFDASGVPAGATLSLFMPWQGGKSGDSTSFSWTPPSVTAGHDYVVNFSVVDSGGLSAQCPVAIHVLPRSPDLPPEADAGPDQSVDEGAVVTLSGSAVLSEGRSATYQWSLVSSTGPEVMLSSSTSPNPAFVPADDGVYTFQLTVTDSAGGSSTDTVTVTVNDVAPMGPYPAEQTVQEGTAFSFSGSFIDPGADTWTATVDYSDGSGEQPLALVGKSFQLNHVYARAGSYLVRVIITDDDGNTGYSDMTVRVTDIAPVLSVSGGSVEQGSPFMTPVSFVDPSGTSWLAYIDYGDYSSEELYLDSHGFTLNHLYNRVGTYEVTITLYDEDGGMDVARVQVEVLNVAPVVSVTCPTSIDEGATFSCIGSVVDPGHDSQFVMINYGDGGSNGLTLWTGESSFMVEHFYMQSGQYPVTVTVTDEYGAETTTTVEVTVNNILPVVQVSGGTIDEGNGFFMAGSFTDADWWGQWDIRVDYGDGSPEETWPGNYSGEFGFNHYYLDSGVYTVTVSVTDHNGGVGTATAQVVVNNVAPQAWVNYAWGNYWGLPVYLDGGATDVSPADFEAGFTATWDLGDGTTAPDFVASPSYANPGSYVAVLSATDKDGASGTASTPIEIMKRPAGLLCDDTSTVFGFPATLSAHLLDDLPGARVGGREISFQIDPSGAPLSGITDETGLGSAQSPSALAPGTYTVYAFFNEDSHYLGAYASCTLTVTQTGGEIIGWGMRFSDEAQGGFSVSVDEAGQLQGALDYVKGSTTFHASTMTALGVAGDKRSGWFSGQGDDGRSFLAYAERHSVPGTADMFKLWIDGELQTPNDPLRGGFVRFP